MLIAVVSDTHRSPKHNITVLDMIKDADVLLHLGDNVEDAEELEKSFDGETYIVAGNCDYSRKYPKDRIIEICGKKIFMTHGDLYGVKGGYNNIYYKGQELGAHIVLFGHSHMKMILRENDMLMMNPGSPSLPRMSNGSIGFIKIDEEGNIDAYFKEVL